MMASFTRPAEAGPRGVLGANPHPAHGATRHSRVTVRSKSQIMVYTVGGVKMLVGSLI